jgi:predicted nuclease with TOPRIM domain
MRAPRKTNPIDDLINELNKPILLLRELKKLRQENERLKEFVSWWDSKYGTVDEMEAIITKLSARNGRLEEELKRLKNATS